MLKQPGPKKPCLELSQKHDDEVSTTSFPTARLLVVHDPFLHIAQDVPEQRQSGAVGGEGRARAKLLGGRRASNCMRGSRDLVKSERENKQFSSC